MNNANAIRTPKAIPCPEATDLDPDYHPCTKTNRRAVLLITILGSSLAFMDGSIVTVALPTLQRAFHAGVSSVQWVVQSHTDGYELVMYCCAVAALLSALPVILWWRGAEIRIEHLRPKRHQLA